MQNLVISKKVHDYLLEHLIEVEKEKDLIVKEYYSEDAVDCMNFESFFNNYISFIKNCIKNATVTTHVADECPFVIIGSIVEVQDIDDKEIYKYCITLPFSDNKDADIDCASCLSPLGKALLLKKVKEKVNIKIPTGTLHYTIKSISLLEAVEKKKVAPAKQ